MQNRETSFERDPHLRRNDSLAQKSANNSGNKWEEAMKGVPSYSEHMKQVEARNAGNQNAFSQATGKHTAAPSRANAISRNVSTGNNTSQGVSSNAIKSASNVQTRSSGGTGQTASVGHGQTLNRSK